MQDFSLRSKWRGFIFFYDGIFYDLVMSNYSVFSKCII